MVEDGSKGVYSTARLHEDVNRKQQQPLIKPKEVQQVPQPPTYEQATIGERSQATHSAASGPSFVVVAEPALVYGPQPTDVECPYCHNFCRTRLHFKPNSRTHLIALMLCLLQLYCCICLPYCIGNCMDTNHHCGMCDKYLGTYKR